MHPLRGSFPGLAQGLDQTMDQDRIRAAQAKISEAQDRPNFGIPIAIDPYGCGCTECLTGEYVPLQLATNEDLVGMILSDLVNHTGHDIGEFQVQDDGQVIKPRPPKEVI